MSERPTVLGARLDGRKPQKDQFAARLNIMRRSSVRFPFTIRSAFGSVR
jgi:hypothetical protein